jgi:hypothetical protein
MGLTAGYEHHLVVPFDPLCRPVSPEDRQVSGEPCVRGERRMIKNWRGGAKEATHRART